MKTRSNKARVLWTAVGLTLTLATTGGADGLPGEYLLSYRWRDLLTRYSPAANPAVITDANYVSVRLVAATLMQTSFGMGEVGVTIPIGLHQSIGVSVLGEIGGDVTESIYDASAGAFGDAERTVRNDNAFAMLTYAIKPWRQLSIGLNANLAYQSNFGAPRYGFGLDLGLTYGIVHHPVAGDHTVGVAVRNLLTPSMTGVESSDATGEGIDEAYSRDIRVSWMGEFLEGRVFGGLDLDLKDIDAAVDDFVSASGEESEKQIEWGLALRAGGWMLKLFEAYGLIGFDQHGVDYWGLAVGMNAPSVNLGRDMAVLYQYSINPESDITSVHSLYCRVDMGLHREERYARRLARMINLLPNELYNRAMTLFSQGMYWDAFFVYSQILAEYPEFFKNDWVSYYRGRCLERLDMRDAAMEVYRQVKIRYGRALVAAHADLGMMRIYYREGDHANVSRQHQALGRVGVPDSLRHHDLYLLGQSLYAQGRFRGAREALRSIPQTHPEYLYAQHSAAVTSFAMDEYTMDAAIEHLTTCVNRTPRNEAEREVINRSYLLLGYAFYEQESMAQAVAALRMVPRESMYYEDALLGLAWTALRAKQWADCRQAGEELVSITTSPVVREEANLVMAYAQIAQKRHNAALPILENAAARLDSIAAAADSEPAQREAQYEGDRRNYDAFAYEIVRGSLQPDEARPAELDSMHLIQKDYQRRLNDYYEYQYLLHRKTFFARSFDKVREDVNYALAVTQRMVETRGARELRQGVIEKQEDINQEIRKLQDELENLDE